MPGSQSLTTAELGRRVTVRYRLAEPAASASATDVVGVLEDLGDATWTVRRRDGSLVRVPADAVIVAKVIADRTEPA